MQAVGDHGVLDAFFYLYTSKWIRNLGDISVNIHESLWKLFGFSKFGTCWNFEIGFKVQMIFQVDFMDAFQHPSKQTGQLLCFGWAFETQHPTREPKKIRGKHLILAHSPAEIQPTNFPQLPLWNTPPFSNQETGKAKNPSFLARANSAQPLRFFLRDVFFPSPSFGGPQKIKPPGRGLNRKKKKRRRGFCVSMGV